MIAIIIYNPTQSILRLAASCDKLYDDPSSSSPYTKSFVFISIQAL